nr:MAG TPA: hypothetical protein [Caudoviricetes sp.]
MWCFSCSSQIPFSACRGFRRADFFMHEFLY